MCAHIFKYVEKWIILGPYRIRIQVIYRASCNGKATKFPHDNYFCSIVIAGENTQAVRKLVLYHKGMRSSCLCQQLRVPSKIANWQNKTFVFHRNLFWWLFVLQIFIFNNNLMNLLPDVKFIFRQYKNILFGLRPNATANLAMSTFLLNFPCVVYCFSADDS